MTVKMWIHGAESVRAARCAQLKLHVSEKRLGMHRLLWASKTLFTSLCRSPSGKM